MPDQKDERVAGAGQRAWGFLALALMGLAWGCARPAGEAAAKARVAEPCSASVAKRRAGAAQPALPPAVESMRQRIIAAALACELEALAALAREGSAEFKFSFGPDADVAAFWREQEREGTPVLGRLVQVLELPYSPQEGDYVWPSAAREGATAADWAALEGLYPPAELTRMREQRGGYVGLRVGISSSGAWLFAIAGD